jgi:hypothetical protein
MLREQLVTAYLLLRFPGGKNGYDGNVWQRQTPWIPAAIESHPGHFRRAGALSIVEHGALDFG